jgi:class 3 adenylate cyclase
MKCPKCQFNNRESARFCKECGSILKLKCPSCGYTYESDSLFCDECGYGLGKAKAPLPADYSQPKSYTPKFLADKILTVRSTIEGERKVVTVLFADVANYTAIAEKLDPEEVHQMMDGCFKILMDKIHTYEGTINQFTGDGIMALFGAPIAHENHAQRACYAALSIQRAIEDYRKQIWADYGLEFKMRFGINSGLVIVGTIGDDLRMDYTAVGDTTNLAKRMESIAKPGNIIVAENTYRLIKAYFELEALGPVTIKGKERAQCAYSLIDSSNIQTRFEAAVSKGLVRFVGRKNSMGTLRNTWNRATEGFGQVLGIMGEPGVGKSRLMLQFISTLFDDDLNYLQGRCLPHGRSIAYSPFLDILKSYFMIKETQSESDINKNVKEKITLLDKEFSPTILSAVQQLLSLEIDDESWHNLEPKQRRKHIFEALKSLLIKLSEEKPLIIAVDDLQWVDRTSEEFLSYFIDTISQNPIFLVLLYRPEYTHPWGNKSHYSKLGLGQLTTKSSVRLISAILEDGAVAAELEQLILKQSAGNPLFIEEFIYSLLENNYIERKENQIVLKRKFDSIKIPDTIHGIVSDRMDKLDVHLKRILQVASVIGHDFGYRILQTATVMGDELKSFLDNLQGLEFIYQKELFPELEYIFKHALVQEVAYNSLLLKRRIEIHAKIGSIIESLYADKLDEFYEILAHHFSSGKDPQKAYQYLKLSGKKAEANFSHLEAFNFFRKALELFHKLPDPEKSNEEKLEIHNLMRRPIAMLGHPKGSLKILKEGAKIAKQVGDQKSLSRYYNDMSLLYTVRGDSLLSIASSEKSFKEAEKIEDIEIMAPVALSLCYAYASSCNYDRLIDITSKVAGIIEKTGREFDFFNTPFNLYSFFLGLCGMAMGMRGDFIKGKIVCEKGLNHAVKAGHTMTLAFGELQYANLLILKGDGKTAIAHCKNSIKYSEDTKWPTILSQAWTILGYSNYLLGELDRAREYVAKGLKIQEDSGIEAMLSLPYWIFAMILYDLGDLEDALRCAEKALELSKKNNEIRYEGLSKIWIGRILGSKKKAQYREGEQFILDGYKILKELSVRPAMAQGHFNLGELYTNSGERIRAVEHFKKARSMFEEMEMDYWLAKAQEALKDL